MNEEREKIQETIEKANKKYDEKIEKEFEEDKKSATKYVEYILTHTAEERYEEMINNSRELIEDQKEYIERMTSEPEEDYDPKVSEDWLSQLEKDLEEEIEKKDQYIAEFEEEKQKWESMSEEEKDANIEKMVEEYGTREMMERNRKTHLYYETYRTVSGSTREAIDVVHDMTESQLQKQDDIKRDIKTVLASGAAFGTIAGVYGGIVEQSLAAGGEGFLAGTAFMATLSGFVLASMKGVGAIKARKIVKQYPEAVKCLKELGIYDIVMEYVAKENDLEWDSNEETFQDVAEEGRSL